MPCTNAFHALGVLRLLFGDERVESVVTKDVKYAVAVPAVCIKNLAGCKPLGGSESIMPVTTVMTKCNDTLLRTIQGDLMKVEDVTIDIIYELYVNGAVSRRQMRRWVFEALPELSEKADIALDGERHGYYGAKEYAKRRGCFKILRFLEATLPVL